MSWLGSGVPTATADGVTHVLPHTDDGGREELWEPEVDQVWTTITGDTIEGDLRFRFRGTYTWSTLSSAQVDQLVEWRNARKRITWRPHQDTNNLAMYCRVAAVEMEPGATVLEQSRVKVEVVSIGLFENIPVLDRRIMGLRQNYLGVTA